MGKQVANGSPFHSGLAWYLAMENTPVELTPSSNAFNEWLSSLFIGVPCITNTSVDRWL
jgi:hypothetical protein